MAAPTFGEGKRKRGLKGAAAKGALAWNNEEWEGKFLVVRKYAPKDGGAKGDAAKEDAPPREEVKKNMMLERFQQENPGFDFRSAEFNGQVPDPRAFMGGVKYT